MKTNMRVLRMPSRVRPTGARGDARSGETEEIDERPKSVYEIVTRRMLEELREDVAEVKGRVNALLWLMLGAMLVEFLMRIIK